MKRFLISVVVCVFALCMFSSLALGKTTRREKRQAQRQEQLALLQPFMKDAKGDMNSWDVSWKKAGFSPEGEGDAGEATLRKGEYTLIIKGMGLRDRRRRNYFSLYLDRAGEKLAFLSFTEKPSSSLISFLRKARETALRQKEERKRQEELARKAKEKEREIALRQKKEREKAQWAPFQKILNDAARNMDSFNLSYDIKKVGFLGGYFDKVTLRKGEYTLIIEGSGDVKREGFCFTLFHAGKELVHKRRIKATDPIVSLIYNKAQKTVIRRNEERRRQEKRQEELARKARKEQFIKKYGVTAWPSTETLLVNPFMYEGKVIGITANFCEMTSATQAIFKLRSSETGPFAVYSKPIIVSGIPRGLFTKEEVVELAGKVLGKKDGRTHLKFVGAYFYKD